MAVPRFFEPGPLPETGEHPLGSATANHVAVRRLAPGSDIVLFDGRGGEYRAELIAAARRDVRVRILEHRHTERESRLDITLLQAVSKGDRMDYAIQKAVELGARRIVPVLTERTVVRLTPERAAKRAEHWRGVAISACEQCGRNRLPEIASPLLLSSAVATIQAGLKLALDPTSENTLRALEPPDGGIALLIGPEGGFTDSEVGQASAAGYLRLRFGPRVLRTETAGPAALAAIQTLWGDLG